MSQLRITESLGSKRENGVGATRTYVITRGTATVEQKSPFGRVDIISRTDDNKQSFRDQLPQRANFWGNIHPQVVWAQLLKHLASLFLPTGYPHTVTADYTLYQIYDSLQAFASTIAGLLASRAVLQSLDIIGAGSTGDRRSDSSADDTSKALTYATLINITTATISNFTTILFAARAAPRINSNVKFYRFLADVVNDIAFVLDLLAPSLPARWVPATDYLPTSLIALSPQVFQVIQIPPPRLFVLCISAASRAICGVAGGSSKAVLSSHFARNNLDRIGDLNAKDSSQETVIGLIGMWVGGWVVSHVTGFTETWTWMLSLLAIHLWTNWCAVKSVRLTSLNMNRAQMVLDNVVTDNKVITCTEAGRKESVLGLRQIFWKVFGRRQWKIIMGASIDELLGPMAATRKDSSGSLVLDDAAILETSTMFEKQAYILWCNISAMRILIVLKEEARFEDQLRSLYHGILVTKEISGRNKDLMVSTRKMQQIIIKTLTAVNTRWEQLEDQCKAAGWNFAISGLEDIHGPRIQIGT